MYGYFALVLHAHLPYVRHPEQESFLEENWLFEAMTETYIPLLQTLEGWLRDNIEFRFTLTLTPTLCSMLLDPLLQARFERYLNGLIDLSEKETHRTHWDARLNPLAYFYSDRFKLIRDTYLAHDRNVVEAFRTFQDLDKLEIMTSAATHGLLPLLQGHPPSVRAQILVARDHYRSCFGRDPSGIWLPECAYAEGVENVLKEAKFRWFITDTHGILHGRPRPRYGIFAPVLTPTGLAVFGRDLESAKQVWSKHEGYPGDGRYRDFYRDIGYDLDFEYLKEYLPASPQRSFTGIKYFAITGPDADKQVYDRALALQAAEEHAQHFLNARLGQVSRLASFMDRPPLLLSPYDAELFGHWWYEGPEFLDALFRKASSHRDQLVPVTPSEFLRRHTLLQIVQPSPSSWGEEGYWKVWLNESNEWIYRHLNVAQERMTEMARRWPSATGLTQRALIQAGRELLLAQASDWPFILRSGTSPDYARSRVQDHLLRFLSLNEQVMGGVVDESELGRIEHLDKIFPDLDYRYWA